MNKKQKKYICVISRFLSEDQKKQWQELWNIGEGRHIFNSPIFFQAYREALGYKRYAVIFCHKKGKIRGVLPLIEDRIFGAKAFSCPGRNGNYADKNAILVGEHKREIFDALFRSASELGNLYLAELDEKEKFFFDFRNIPGITETVSLSRWLVLSEHGSVLSLMSKGQKQTLLKRIQLRKKDLKFSFFKTNLEEALKEVIEVEKGSYKFNRHTALFGHKTAEALFRNFIKRGAQYVRVGILYFRHKPAATVLGFVYGKTFAGYHIAFVEDQRKWGAGKAAVYFMLEYLKKEGFTKIDLLRGDTNFKRQFANNAKKQYDFYFSKNPFLLLWWRMCITVKNSLKKIKMFFDAVLSVSDSSRRAFYFKLSENIKKYFEIPRDFSAGKKNIFAVNYRNRGKKPVIFFSSYDDRKNPYYAGGGAYAVHEVAKRLAARFEVHVLTGKYPHCLKSEFLDGVYYEHIGSCILGPKLGHLIFHCTLPFYVSGKAFDLWVESFTPPFSTSFLPLFTKKPVIGLVHMLAAEDMMRKYKIPFSFIENFGIKMYDNFIVLTEQSGKKIKRFNPLAHIEVIPNGINLSLLGSQSAKKHLLFIGRIEMDQKGLDLLLESYRLISDRVGCPLAIAGQGEAQEEQKLMKMADELKISDRIKFLGRVEGRKKAEIFQEAIAVIIPSRYETFSLVALEALACGIPIISFDIEGLKWLPEKFSFKIKPFDTFAMAMAMKKLAEQDNYSAIDPEEIKNFLKDYSWEAIAEKFGRRIDSIIKLNI